MIACRARLVTPSARPGSRSVVAGAFAPPTVSETKAEFLKIYDVPVGSLYNNVIQELLVQQHFMRYNIAYSYDEVFALGVVSVFNQILEDAEEKQRTDIFDAYIKALKEEPSQYRQDADKMQQLAEACTSAEDLKPDDSGSEVQQILAKVAAKTASNEFFYTRFFAIGLFRLLELTGARDPKALDNLVKAVQKTVNHVQSLGVNSDSVNKDLLLYKGILSKMVAAKELMKEVMDRERRKQEERDAVTKKDEEVAESVPSASAS